MSIKGHYITYLLKLSILEIEAILGETDIQRGKVNLFQLMELFCVRQGLRHSSFRIYSFNNEYVLSVY